jgi:hypothetical protein
MKPGPKPGQAPRPARPLLDRVMERIEQSPMGCWLWTGTTSSHGYARIAVANGQKHGEDGLVHRILYEYFFGSFPVGLTSDHLCRVRRCVNPTHIEPVTTKINVLRGTGITARSAQATHCIHGHPFDERNTLRDKRDGHRSCRACCREKMRRRRQSSRLSGVQSSTHKESSNGCQSR